MTSKRITLLAWIVIGTGCAAPRGTATPAPAMIGSVPKAVVTASEPQPIAGMPIVAAASYQDTVSHQGPAQSDPLPSANQGSDAGSLFAGQAEFSAEQLVAEVEARNPSLGAARAAWRAAAQRYPQVISLDDPMFGFMVSPSGVGTDDGGGWMVETSQKIPASAKRLLRGTAAQAEADVMRGDFGDTRLKLGEMARMAFYDYYLARRQMEVVVATRTLLMDYRAVAKNKYEVNQATEQDVLQADVELAVLESRRLELARDDRVAAARINTLLHREPTCLLPPPPKMLAVPAVLPSADLVQQAALRARPDLFAQAARVRAEEANLALANKEYCPDPELVFKYDGFMPQEMRPQVGVNINVPLRFDRRSAAVREACFRLQQRRAEYQDRLDQVRFEVQSALERAAQSEQVVRLYEDKILPTTQRGLDSALANYTNGKLDFLRLLDAQRQLNRQREAYYQAIADYHRRVAELQRAVGEQVVSSQ